jgi:hypothetical protein
MTKATRALVPLAAFALYARTLGFDFVNRDDDTHVLRQPLVTGELSLAHFRELLLTPALGYPAATSVLLHHAVYHLAGPAPWAFHLASVLLHAAISWLVYLLAKRLALSELEAVAVGLLFALHPVDVETVCWVSNAKSLCAALFFVLVCVELLAPAPRAWWMALAFVLGAFSKPTIVFVVPVVVTGYAVLGPKMAARRFAALVAFLAAASAALVAYSIRAQGEANALRVEASRSVWLREVWYALGLQLRLAFACAAPSPIHIPVRPPPFEPVTDLFPFGLALLFVGVARIASPERRAVVWFAAALVAFPVLQGVNLVPQNRYLGDTFSYLSAIGTALFVVVALEPLVARAPRWAPVAATSMGAIAFSAASFVASEDWRDGYALWSSVARRNPNSPEPCMLTGHALLKMGHPAEALAQYQLCEGRFGTDLRIFRQRALAAMGLAAPPDERAVPP